MSKVNQIQQALLEMSGGAFQKLADAYLHEKGRGNVHSTGSVVAANKVKSGTPDALIATPDGNYMFVESTTQKTDLLRKMMGDLCKCFDESKTGVPVEKIKRAVFCFTGQLNPKEIDELTEACQERGVPTELCGIDVLAFDLYAKYPGLARDFLNVSIDTGQIVSLDRFASLHNNNKLSTRLDHKFHFREEELDTVLAALAGGPLVILSGPAGVGKSRLALEACERFGETHSGYEVLCIFGRNKDLWEDLQVRFTKPGRFLIFVDDANRVSRFEYIVDLLQHQRKDQQTKVVATVRDYALAKVRDAARPLGGHSEVQLRPLDDKEIKELVNDEYGICDYRYQERIADIARGNPRLAVMAAEVAKEAPLISIHDVSTLYDSYFSSIREDLSKEGADLESTDLLRVAAIVSFFKAVDRTNEEMMNAIKDAFGVTPNDFWEAADRLHEMELFNMYEKEVVQVADQVLATYLFYLAFFKDEVLDFGALLRHFFPSLRDRFIDSIDPVLSAFDTKMIIDLMRSHVGSLWRELEEANKEQELLSLLQVFWFTNRTDTLRWVRDRIDLLEPESVEIARISFEKGSDNPPSPSILSLLGVFDSPEVDEVRMALDLLLRYVARRPKEVPLVLRVLIDDYGFTPNSYRRAFGVQQAVVHKLWNRAESGDLLFSRIFLAVANNYLGTRFENDRMKNSSVLEIRRFDLPATPHLATLREAIWQGVFALHGQEDLRDDVLGVVRHYTTGSLDLTNSEVVRSDAKHVLPFLESVLTPTVYLHCAVMHEYLDLLEEHGGEVPKDLRNRFRNDTFLLAEILLLEWDERWGQDSPVEEYEEHKRNRLDEQTKNYTVDDYARFFDRCMEIRMALNERQNESQLQWGAESVLLSLAERNSDMYTQVLEQYLESEDPLCLNGHPLVQKLVELRGYDEALRLLRKPQYPMRVRWLFHVHEVLPPDDVDENKLAHLYKLYETAERTDLPYGLDYLFKYLPLEARVVARVVSTLVAKAELDSSFAYGLQMLLNPHTQVAKRVSELFAEDIDLLKRAYLILEPLRRSRDYKGQMLNRLLDLDPAFIAECLRWKYDNAKDGHLSSYTDHKDYSFIWLRSDYQEIMDRVVDTIYDPQRDPFSYVAPYLKRFFPSKGEDREPEGEIRERQDAYLLRLIDERCQNTDFMRYLFGVIGRFTPARRCQFIERFVQQNNDFETFRRLSLEPNSWTSCGSWVPVLQGRIAYWGSLLPIMSTVDLLDHRKYVESRIEELQAEMKLEEKRDFVRD